MLPTVAPPSSPASSALPESAPPSPPCEPHAPHPCVPCLLAELAQAPGGGLALASRHLPRGTVLFRQGEPLRHLYAVRSGTFKLTATDARSREQVIAFRSAGELLGLDGLDDERHHVTAVALDTAETASLPTWGLRDALAARPDLFEALVKLLGRELLRNQKRIVLLGTLSAEERLAAFLLNFAVKNSAPGMRASEFVLPMSRADIASYLALRLETVCRVLHRFELKGVLELGRRHVRLLSPDALLAFFGRGLAEAPALKSH